MQSTNQVHKRANICRTVMLLIFTFMATTAIVAQSGEAPTKSAAPPFVCSDQTLTGRFATRASGYAPANPMDPASPLVPFANVSLMTFDGQGGLTNEAVNSNNGTIIPGSNPGSYELEPNCTGTLVISGPFGPLSFYLVVGDRGRELFMISTVRSVVTVEGVRVQ